MEGQILYLLQILLVSRPRIIFCTVVKGGVPFVDAKFCTVRTAGSILGYEVGWSVRPIINLIL